MLFGLSVDSEIEEAGAGKKSREQRKAEAARKRVLDRILGDAEGSKGGGYADPALMFK